MAGDDSQLAAAMAGAGLNEQPAAEPMAAEPMAVQEVPMVEGGDATPPAAASDTTSMSPAKVVLRTSQAMSDAAMTNEKMDTLIGVVASSLKYQKLNYETACAQCGHMKQLLKGHAALETLVAANANEMVKMRAAFKEWQEAAAAAGQLAIRMDTGPSALELAAQAAETKRLAELSCFTAKLEQVALLGLFSKFGKIKWDQMPHEAREKEWAKQLANAIDEEEALQLGFTLDVAAFAMPVEWFDPSFKPVGGKEKRGNDGGGPSNAGKRARGVDAGAGSGPLNLEDPEQRKTALKKAGLCWWCHGTWGTLPGCPGKPHAKCTRGAADIAVCTCVVCVRARGGR